jgi:hypothetical protein
LRTHVLDRHDPGHIARAYEAVYEQALKG